MSKKLWGKVIEVGMVTSNFSSRISLPWLTTSLSTAPVTSLGKQITKKSPRKNLSRQNCIKVLSPIHTGLLKCEVRFAKASAHRLQGFPHWADDRHHIRPGQVGVGGAGAGAVKSKKHGNRIFWLQ